jgi:hypothetical protein
MLLLLMYDWLIDQSVNKRTTEDAHQHLVRLFLHY